MTQFSLAFIFFVAALAPAGAQVRMPPKDEKFMLFAQFVADTTVYLSDGAEWRMDKGDCFPVEMLKDHQTKIVLRLGSSNFTTEMKNMRLMKDAEHDLAMKSYRGNLESFLKSRTDAWKREAEAAKNSAAKPPEK